MKISYNWLKWYIPDAPSPEEIADIFTFHLCEVENLENIKDDTIFDIKILPDRAHDLLSHLGVAKELASLLNLKFIDPTLKYKIPETKLTELKIDVESQKCRRYMGRIVRNVKMGPSPEWVVKHLESIGQRSINNMVDAANIVMYDCGQPTHVFDLNKIQEKLVVRLAKDGESLVTLDNKDCKLTPLNLVIADAKNALAIAGVKGGKIAEVDNNTKDIILEVANFDPTSIRKTAQMLNIFTDAKKRFENDLSPELCSYTMTEFSALISEMCPEASFEDVVDIYPQRQEKRKLSFGIEKISKILGISVTTEETKNILERYNFEYINKGEQFEIVVPPMRFDLSIEEDMAEEIGRILGYDKVLGKIPKIDFTPKQNELRSKMVWARSRLLDEGYNEVMTYTFRDSGEVEVLASASDKKFLRNNLSDGIKESLKLNLQNAPLLGMKEIKIFEIGTVFKKEGEKMHVAFGDKKEIKEMILDEFCKSAEPDVFVQSIGFLQSSATSGKNFAQTFHMWSLFPFIVRDIAVWVREDIKSEEVEKVIKENAGDMVVRGPELFDQFKKDGNVSYAFRIIFQSYERTLTDEEVNVSMDIVNNKIKEKGWKVR